VLQLTGEIPGGQPWPVFAWAVVGITAFVIAGMAKPVGMLAAGPCWALPALMIIYGVLQNVHAVTYSGIGLLVVGVLVLVLMPKAKAQLQISLADSRK
jgi:hypothetical protein